MEHLENYRYLYKAACIAGALYAFTHNCEVFGFFLALAAL